jgi:hypothetical protein
LVEICQDVHYLEATSHGITSGPKTVCPIHVLISGVLTCLICSDGSPTLEDEIYDSFGITIPLIQFHNFTWKAHHAQVGAREFSANEILGSDRDEEERDKKQAANLSAATKTTVDTRRNSFKLEFIGGKQPVTDYHPYVVTR